MTPERAASPTRAAAQLADEQRKELQRAQGARRWLGLPARSRRRGSPPEMWNADQEREVVARGVRPHPLGAPAVAGDRAPPDARRHGRRRRRRRSPIAVGAALANKDKGILTVTFQPDGDLMYAPGALWTAAHHKIPLLMLMHNNRCYHQEIMHVQRMAALHDRRPTRRASATITDPRHRFREARAGHGRVGGRADHRSGPARAGDQARGRGSEERPARAGRCGVPAALRIGMTPRTGASIASCVASAGVCVRVACARAGARGIGRARREALRREDVLHVPRLQRPGRRTRVRPARGARRLAVGGVRAPDAPAARRHAALFVDSSSATRSSPTSTPGCRR